MADNAERIASMISPVDPWPVLTEGLQAMSAGNPELVIEDGWLVRKFIDDFLSGGNIDVYCGSKLTRMAEVVSEVGEDGFPWLAGWVLDEDYEYVPMGNAHRYQLSIPWESITRISL